MKRFLLIVCVVALPAAAIEVTGTVTSPAGTVAGAVVEFRTAQFSEAPNVSATTDAAGKFVANMPQGLLWIHVAPPPGSTLLGDDVRVEVKESLTMRLRMAPPVTLNLRAAVPAALPAGNLRFEVYSLTTNRRYEAPATGGGTWTLDVFPDLYSVHAWHGSADFYFGRTNVDARSSSQSVEVTVKKNEPILTRTPPRAALVSVSAADANGLATISGAPGCVEAMSAVAIVNLNTQQVNLTVSQNDGSFSLPLFAPPGSHLQIKHDPTGRYLPDMNLSSGSNDNFEVPPGTIVYVNPAVSWSAPGIVRQVMGSDLHLQEFRATGLADSGQWWLTSNTSPGTLAPGQSVPLTGKLTIYSKEIDAALNLASVTVNAYFGLEKTVDSTAAQRDQDYQFASSVMTPSGLPIERSGFGRGFASIQMGPLRFVADGRLEANWSATLNVPANMQHGFYQPRLFVGIQGIPQKKRSFDTFPTPEPGRHGAIPLPMVKIGTPPAPKLACMLALDHPVNGLRGSIANEGRGKFQVASHVAISSDVSILPPVDLRTGEAIRYSLEPFAPLVSSSNGRTSSRPVIPFKFPSGSLTVRVVLPDGTTENLGSAPFQQSMSRSPITRSGLPIAGASAHVTDYLQLTTLDPRFQYAFTQHGLHRVLLDMTIEDVSGNVYRGGGTYEIWVARPLDLETAVVPGAPFEIGNVFSPSLIVQPGVAADVTVRLQIYPNSDASKVVVHEVSGRANRFGVFTPLQGFPPFTQPGEYRVDVFARYTDSSGVMWAGTATWGNVIETPNSPLVTHGRRGFDGVNAIQQQWFRVREARAGGDHVMFPFHRGDVMWMQHDDPAADIPKITVQDPVGTIAARVRSRNGGAEPPSLEERITAGQIPLTSTIATGESVSFVPEKTDQWGYFYGYAERPGVRVREFVSEDASSNGYWRFADNYNFQLGNGINGDRPNDFKFQFGGAVWRDATGFSYYGAYGSLFVLLPFQDEIGGRVFPPFQGNGGGPSGGPLFTLKGKAIDLFFHPTGVRPGTILVQGDVASFTGHVAPTLPSKISIEVTSPSGQVRTISGRTNKVGYFYDNGYNFTVSEAGVWKAKVRVTFDGIISSGQVTPPFPTGDVLGSREGEFYFYVLHGGTEPLALAPMPQFIRPADGPITFAVIPPSGLTNVQLTYTTTMPGFILEEGTKSALTYTYDAPRLARDFPNLDLQDPDGFAGADTITITLFLTGTDATNVTRHLARQIVIQGEELQLPEQKPILTTRRRSAK